jgi:hypothetical protein
MAGQKIRGNAPRCLLKNAPAAFVPIPGKEVIGGTCRQKSA